MERSFPLAAATAAGNEESPKEESQRSAGFRDGDGLEGVGIELPENIRVGTHSACSIPEVTGRWWRIRLNACFDPPLIQATGHGVEICCPDLSWVSGVENPNSKSEGKITRVW